MAYERNAGGSGTSNPVNSGGKIGGAAINLVNKDKKKETEPRQTGLISTSEIGNPVNSGNFSKSKERAAEEATPSYDDWERQEQERLLAEERRRKQEYEQEQNALKAEQWVEKHNKPAEQPVTDQPSAGYMPYGDPRLKPNPVTPSAYVGEEQLNDYATWQAQQEKNNAVEFEPVYSMSEQKKDVFKAGAKTSAENEDETEFYTGTPQTDVDVTNPMTYNMDTYGLTGVGPNITVPNPIEYGIQQSIQEYNNSDNPLKEWLAKSYPKYTGNNDARQPYAGFYNGRELMQPQAMPPADTRSNADRNAVYSNAYVAAYDAAIKDNIDLGRAQEIAEKAGSTAVEQYDKTGEGNTTPLGTQPYTFNRPDFSSQPEENAAYQDAYNTTYKTYVDNGLPVEDAEAAAQAAGQRAAREYELAHPKGTTTAETPTSNPVNVGVTDLRAEAGRAAKDAGYENGTDEYKKFVNDYMADASKSRSGVYTDSSGNPFYNMGVQSGGFADSYDPDRMFYDLTSELAGNAYMNATQGTNYNTTPGFINPSGDLTNPLNQNTALQAGLSGQLTPEQILHFYDAGYSNLNTPADAQKWMASDVTHALQELYLNDGKSANRLEHQVGSEDELKEAVRSLINANPELKAMYENGNLTPGDIALNFMKAPVDNNGDLVGSYANGGNGGNSGKSTEFTPSYEQGGTGVKAPYKSGGYTSAELEAMGNRPYTDASGRTQYEGYYLAPNGNWYPVDQEKAAYYQRYGTYNGWDEGMRDYYKTFGTFYGYSPTWKSTGRNYSGGSRNYSYSRGGSSSYYSPTYTNRNFGSTTTPTTVNQRQSRIYNIMKNWSF